MWPTCHVRGLLTMIVRPFYTDFSEAFSDRNEMDTRVALIDANTGPGEWRDGRSHIVGPHGIPFAKKGLDKDDNHFRFNYFCWN